MCDTLCIRRPGGMLFAKNSDRPVDEAQVVETFGSRPAGGTQRVTHIEVADLGAGTVVGSRPTWMWGVEHGVNTHRVAIGNERVWTTDDPHAAPDALVGMDLVRLALERAHDADEALDVLATLLSAYGQGGSGEQHGQEPYWSSFLLVDPEGGWHLETSGSSWVAAPVGTGTSISNRLSLGTDWTRASPDIVAGTDWDLRRDPAAPTGIADQRLVATGSCVESGGDHLGPATIVATLRDHGSGPWGAPGSAAALGEVAPPPPPADIGDDWSGVTVCMHLDDFMCTAASMVCWLPDDHDEPLRMWASLGSPCVGVFLPGVVLPAGVVLVEQLASASHWRALAELARRVEAPGDEGRAALVEVRQALGPLEARAWEEADQLAAEHADIDAWRQAATRWGTALDGVLDSLHA